MFLCSIDTGESRRGNGLEIGTGFRKQMDEWGWKENRAMDFPFLDLSRGIFRILYAGMV